MQKNYLCNLLSTLIFILILGNLSIEFRPQSSTEIATTNPKSAADTINPSVMIDFYTDEVEYLIGSLQVNATIFDDDQLNRTQIQISRSDDSILGIYNMTLMSSTFYSFSWETTSEFLGNYSFTIIAEDVSGNVNDTEKRPFEIVNTHQKVPLWTALPDAGIHDVKISSDGNYIAVGTEANIYLFDTANSSPLWEYHTTYGGREVAISSDGNYIAAVNSGGGGGNVFLFEKGSSTPLWTHNNPDGGYTTVAISSDGNYIAAGGENSMFYHAPITLFNKSSSTPLWSHDPGHYVNDITISPDGNYIVAAIDSAEEGEKVILFQKDSSIPVWSFTLNETVWSVDISSDGNYIAAGSGGNDNRVYLFNRSNSVPLWNYSTGGYSVLTVDISSDGNYIVAGIENGGGKVLLFSKNSSTPIWTYSTGINPQITSVAISSDGEYIIAGNWEYHLLDEYGEEEIDYGNIYFFKRESNIPAWHYRTGTIVFSVSISSNGKYAVGGSDEGIHVFDVDTTPSLFTVYSNADDPDEDGIFELIWNPVEDAQNYSIYVFNNFISEINQSLTLLANQNATSPYLINLISGAYYYIVVAHKQEGDFVSNCIKVTVSSVSIIIHYPHLNQEFGHDAPSYNISVTGPAFDSLWYSLNIGITNITITEFSGVIDQAEWDAISDGLVTIRFHAKDKGGNIFTNSVLVSKNTSEEGNPPAIPGFDVYFLLGTIWFINVIIITRRKDLSTKRN